VSSYLRRTAARARRRRATARTASRVQRDWR